MIALVADSSQVAEARRAAAAFVRRAGQNEDMVGRISLIATEMATNLVKHGGGGSLVVEYFDDGDGSGIELLAIDRGAGMADLQRCLVDGYSTAGSPGNGLGTIGRQADLFAAFSRPGLGTAIMARTKLANGAATPTRCEIGSVVAPYPGEEVCGDRWAVAYPACGPTLFMIDGSGHGIYAAQAADIGVRVFRDNADRDCERLAEAIHRALAPTRGGAIAVARLEAGEQTVRFIGIGNIVGALAAAGEVKRMVSHNGTAGQIAPRIRAFAYPYTGTPLVILHSDGLTAKWDLAAYPGLAHQHPSLVAAVLFRDHRRGRDDASIVALKQTGT